MFCGVCHRRMEGHWANRLAYYRCRLPQTYAVSGHPRNVCIREDALLPHLDRWLAGEFAPTRIKRTLDALAQAADDQTRDSALAAEASRRVTECDRKLKGYKATLDAGGDPAVVCEWIRQTQGDRTAALALLRQAECKPTITRDQIRRTIENLGDMVKALTDGPADRKADIYQGMGLRAAFDPETRKVRASVDLAPSSSSHWGTKGVRGQTQAISTPCSPHPPGSFFLVRGGDFFWNPLISPYAGSSGPQLFRSRSSRRSPRSSPSGTWC